MSNDDEGSNVSLMKGHIRAGLDTGRAPFWLGGLAAFGIVVAHCIAYILVAPEGEDRALLMDATGHRFWGLVFAFALGAAVAGMSFLLVRFFHPSTAHHRKLTLFGFAAPRLMALQLGGFVLLEAIERIFMGEGAHAILEPVVILGLAVQVGVALAAALILCLLTKTLHALLSPTHLPSSSAERALPRPTTRWLKPSLAPGTGAGTWRGPPLRA
jgi:hypothetical protein